MKTLTPYNQTVICQQIVKPSEQVSENGYVYNKNQLPIYKVLQVSSDLKDEYQIDDLLVCDCNPSKIVIDNNNYYLIKAEHIAGKIVQ